MNNYNSFENPNVLDQNAFSNLTNNQRLPLHFLQNSTPNNNSINNNHNNNIFQSGNFENESYRMIYNNTFQTGFPNSQQNRNSFFLAYLQSKKSYCIGPILMNVSYLNNSNNGEPFTMECTFLNQDHYIEENPNKIYQLKEIQTRFESMLSSKNMYSKDKFGDSQEFMRELYQNDGVKFQVVQLPFDQFKITSTNHSKNKIIESGSQTIDFPDNTETTKDEYLKFMKQEIQLLKDQNQLLKTQLEIKSKEINNTLQKEYVLRKNSFSTKLSRNPSATSTVINLDSHGSNSPNKTQTTSSTSEKGALQLYEILQEYMLENEALRVQNNSLNEMRARHHTEIEFVFKQNQSLSEKVKELSRQISQLSVRNSENIAPEMLNVSNGYQKEHLTEHQNRGYPIMYEKPQITNERNSYLYHYDSLKQKLNQDVNKKGIQPAVQNEKRNSSPDRSTNSIVKSENNQSIKNDILREELGRIDNTIKEHIRKTQFSDTLRNMGVKQNVARK